MIRTGNGRIGNIAWTAAVVCLMIFAAVSVARSASGRDGWRAVVRSAACVEGPTVLLGEIADPAPGVDRRTWKSVAGVKLWKASSRRGRPVVIARDKLRQVLNYYMGDMADRLVLLKQLTVQTGGKVVSGVELKNRVVAFLTPKAKSLGGDIEFRDLNLPSEYFIDNPAERLVIGLHDDIRPGRNQIQFKTLNARDKVVYSKAGTVFIDVWKAVPVASQSLNRFERVTKNKIGFRRVNLAYRPDLWDGTGGPWRMARTLGRNQPFTMSHLEQVPLIEKGERVDLVYRGKRIQLTLKVEALDDGAMGQQVAVKNLQSKKTVLATVIGDDLVMVR
jgi:flagella basal body P-ring formation protein FlgA